MSELLQDGTSEIQRSDPRLHDALVRMERELLNLRGQNDVAPGVALFGPFPFSQGATIRPGNVVWIVSGRLTKAYNESAWMGEHALGVAVDVKDKKAFVQMAGPADLECIEASASVPLTPGATMFVSGSKGRAASGWPRDGKDVYQIGHVVGEHKVHTVRVALMPLPLMRFG